MVRTLGIDLDGDLTFKIAQPTTERERRYGLRASCDVQYRCVRLGPNSAILDVAPELLPVQHSTPLSVRWTAVANPVGHILTSATLFLPAVIAPILKMCPTGWRALPAIIGYSEILFENLTSGTHAWLRGEERTFDFLNRE